MAQYSVSHNTLQHFSQSVSANDISRQLQGGPEESKVSEQV